MPRATLTFKLPDEQQEFNMAVDVGKFFSFIHEFGNHLRAIRKWSEDEPSFEEIYDKWHEMLQDENISEYF